MLNCDAVQSLMVDALYVHNEPSEDKALREHLHSCQSCQALWQEMSQALDTIKDAGIQGEMNDGHSQGAVMDTLWENLQPALDKVDAERYRKLPKGGRSALTGLPAFGAALAACLALALGISTLTSPPVTVEQPIAAAPLVSPELMNYLDRAQVMLLLVANAESENVSVIPVRDSFARDMAQEASLLRVSADDQVKSGQRRLLKDIEFLLMQIANLDESNMAEGIALLQRYLEDNSVLFKIRLLEMRDQEMII